MEFPDNIVMPASGKPILEQLREGRKTPVASFPQDASNCKEGVMEAKDLKKFLAGFGIASLLAGVGVATSVTKAVGASG